MILRIFSFILFILIVTFVNPRFVVYSAPQPTITTRWISSTRIEVCTNTSGALYVAGAWAWIGDVTAGCRPFPPDDWKLIDTIYAPSPGKQYCLYTQDQLTCAEPLSSQRFFTYLPAVVK